MIDVVALGELLIDFATVSTNADGYPTMAALPGGAPANFAYHATCLGGNGVAISAVGCDSLGDEVVELLDAKGVNHHIARVDAPTGVVRVTKSDVVDFL